FSRAKRMFTPSRESTPSSSKDESKVIFEASKCWVLAMTAIMRWFRSCSISWGHHTIRAVALALLAGSLARGEPFDHSVGAPVLKSHANEIGEVDYAALKAHRANLDEYIRRLAGSSPENHPHVFPTRAHELAYWINAYNAFVIRGVVDHYPTRSVLDLGMLKRFFWRGDSVAGGVTMSLYHLENGIIRKKYGEPRIHFAIVCASMSCPMLERDA